jgi:DNA invertase Pin-like site-specific DNA recombinase
MNTTNDWPDPNLKIVPVAAYLRVSTDDQARPEHYSLEQQEDFCRAEIQKRQSEGWVLKITISDPGYSGATLERPGLLKLIAMAKKGEIGAIVVFMRDRLFRDGSMAAQVQMIFDYHNIIVVSSQGVHDRTPQSVFMRQLIDAQSQLERANIRLRILSCLRFSAARGDWKGGPPPFGYNYVPGSKVLTLSEIEAPKVKMIFERIAAGVAIGDLVQELRRLKVYGRQRTIRPIAR